MEKTSAAQGWPTMKGEYRSGNVSSCVAVVTCGSHLDDSAFIDAGAAISGSCKTENLGIEKLVTHIVSNPNIRYLIVTGTEVKGHITGEAILMLHKNGISENRIIGAKGAIPYIENLSSEAIERFREQVECIDMINIEDKEMIISRIQNCTENDPGAFPGEPIVPGDIRNDSKAHELNESDASAETSTDNLYGISETSQSTGLALEEIVSLRLKIIDAKLQDIGNLHKFKAGFHTGKIVGFVVGFLAAVGLLGMIFFVITMY